MVTITGAAGMGKTRLAVHAAIHVAPRYSGGAWFVDMSALDSPDAVADVVLGAVGGTRPCRSGPRGVVLWCCWTTVSMS